MSSQNVMDIGVVVKTRERRPPRLTGIKPNIPRDSRNLGRVGSYEPTLVRAAKIPAGTESVLFRRARKRERKP